METKEKLLSMLLSLFMGALVLYGVWLWGQSFSESDWLSWWRPSVFITIGILGPLMVMIATMGFLVYLLEIRDRNSL